MHGVRRVKTFHIFIQYVLDQSLVWLVSVWMTQTFPVYSEGLFFRHNRQKYSLNNSALKTLPKWKENTCARALFLIKLQVTCNFIEKEALAQVFPLNFLRASIHRTPPDNHLCSSWNRLYPGEAISRFSTK